MNQMLTPRPNPSRVRSVSFTQPGPGGAPTAPPVPQKPNVRSDLLATMLSRQGGRPDYANTQGPLDGLAKMLTEGVQGFYAKKALEGEEQKKAAKATMLADLLLPPGEDGQPDPRREALIGALSSGAVGADAFSDAIASKMGFGPAPELETAKPGETLGRVVNGEWVPIHTEPAKLPTSAAEHQYSLDNPGYSDWAIGQKKAGATVINTGPSGIDYGDPEKGYAWARHEDGSVVERVDPETGLRSPVQVPIAGGSVERDRAEDAEQAEGRADLVERFGDIVTEDIDRAIGQINDAPFPITGLGALTSGIPGSPGRNLAALIDTIKANVGFDRLQQMRAASPTGGALGQVSEFENRLLQATLGNLELSQDKDQLIYNLNRVKRVYATIITKGIKEVDPIVGEILSGGPPPTREEIEEELRQRGY